MDWGNFFAGLSDEDVAVAWSRAMSEMRARGLVRSSNSPVADYAERIAANELGLELAPKVAQGYDATACGRRYQVKSRRLTAHNKRRQLGVVRKLDDREFDELIAVLFDEELRVLEMWRIPHDVVVEYASWAPRSTAIGYT